MEGAQKTKFWNSVKSKFGSTCPVSKNKASSIGSSVRTIVSFADRQIGTTIKYKLFNLYVDFQKAVYVDCNYTEGLANIPMKFNDAVYGDEDETYTVFMTPGMLLTLVLCFASAQHIFN